MSYSRLNKSQSRSQTKSFLHQPIEFRKVMHHRTDHHPKEELQTIISTPKNRAGPSESHLERLINLDGQQKRQSRASKNLSFSHSQAGRRQNMTPLDQLHSPKVKQLLKNSSFSQPPERQQTSKSILLHQFSPTQQKLSIKQQNGNLPNSNEAESVRIQLQIERINSKVTKLVNKKLQLMFDSLHSKKKEHYAERKEEINEELQKLLAEIKHLQSKTNEVNVFNQKITFIETLMAEQSTEAELMKKYYYNISSNKLKGKIGDFNHLRTRVGDAYKSLPHYDNKNKKGKNQLYPKDIITKKPLFKETTNKSSYQSPHKSDYESYRYRQKCTPLNLQPLPRSSYKRDFLYLKSLPNEKIINRDHYPYYPNTKARVGSIYGQDYKNMKTENVDHRELDAFKNKITTLKINYMPKNRVETIAVDRKDYYKDVEETSKSRIRSNNSRLHHISEQELNFNKKTHLSESRREYLGEKTYEPSKIKHQQLQSIQYKLKHLFQA